jgi:hypothetical protein
MECTTVPRFRLQRALQSMYFVGDPHITMSISLFFSYASSNKFDVEKMFDFNFERGTRTQNHAYFLLISTSA